MPRRKLLLRLEKSTVEQTIPIELPEDELFIDKSLFGKDKEEKERFNILALARTNRFVRELVIRLANNGFFLVAHDTGKGISRFKKLKDYAAFAPCFGMEDLRVWNDTFYTLESPLAPVPVLRGRLLVIFSSIADYPLNASIARRSFFRNWDKAQSYLPKDTSVLRIADIGGVLGSFYLDSNFDDRFEDKVQAIIGKIAADLSIRKEDIVLFGTSKGATAALYHGVRGGYKAVAVDPIVSDEYYLKEMDDLHFVEGAFPASKEEKFGALFSNHADFPGITIITSKHSQQYKYICQLVAGTDCTCYVVNNPLIKSHTDMGRQTRTLWTTIINAMFYGIYKPHPQIFEW